MRMRRSPLSGASPETCVAELPVLEIPYANAVAFRRDYEADLSNGGVFVPTTRPFELREPVTVCLELSWCGRRVELAGEVVHIVAPEMTGVGGKPGVAVQFHQSAFEVRDQLAPLTFDSDPDPDPDPAPDPAPDRAKGEDRHALRKTARVATRIDWRGGRVTGCTRNLSRSGVLIGVQEGTIPLGETATVTMRHPTSGEEFEVRGRVARHVEGEGSVTALGIAFESDEASRASGVEHFISEVMGAEHTRRLGAISGPIAELGPHSIVQMLANSAPRGTIILRRGDEEGSLCFESGLLQSVRLGSLSGMEALIAMLGWRDGVFEFVSRLEGEPQGPPLPLEAAILEAVRQMDEQRRIDPQSFPLQARLVRTDRGEESEDQRSTTEAALLDLASAGFTVSRALEVIPESDAEIFRALQDLIDAKALELH